VQFLEGGSAALPDRYRISVAWSEPGQRSISTQLQIVDLLSRLAP
jgi:hypothetical protein